MNRQSAYHCVAQLRSPEYLEGISRLPFEQQQVKHKLYEAFQALLALYEHGHQQQVEAVAQQILSIAPKHPEAYLVMGHLCVELFNTQDKAVALLNEYRKYNTRSSSVWALLASAYFKLDL